MPDKYLEIFGQLKPKYVDEQFVIRKIFSKGEDERSYMQEERGSSVDWDDQSEFATPFIDRRLDLSKQNGLISQSEQRNPTHDY